MCDMVATQPLPIRVVSLTGHGEFFDRGDLAPRQATLIVGGDEDPLVADLRFDELLSAALAERARRRNAQVTAAHIRHLIRNVLDKVELYPRPACGETERGSAGARDTCENISPVLSIWDRLEAVSSVYLFFWSRASGRLL